MQAKSTSKPRANQTAPNTNKTAHYFKSPQAQAEMRRLMTRTKGRDLTEGDWYKVLSLLSDEGRANLRTAVDTLLGGTL